MSGIAIMSGIAMMFRPYAIHIATSGGIFGDSDPKRDISKMPLDPIDPRIAGRARVDQVAARASSLLPFIQFAAELLTVPTRYREILQESVDLEKPVRPPTVTAFKWTKHMHELARCKHC